MACLVTSLNPVPLKTRRVGQRCTLNLSRVETSSHWCGVVVRRGGNQLRCRPRHLTMFNAVIVEVEIGGVAIYRPFGEFRRAKSYCHLYGAQGQRQAYFLALATMNFVDLDLTRSDSYSCQCVQVKVDTIPCEIQKSHLGSERVAATQDIETKITWCTMETPKVWVPDPVSGYKLGKIIDIKSETVSVQLLDSKEVGIITV
ncbi:uncharacterized protein TNCV_108571 [Trichonephila clavipes]|nr:uncharacterized protein TNCV_108571 [Trichonephila clavipes]